MHKANPKAHWEKVYQEKAPEAVSWFRPHLDTDLSCGPRLVSGELLPQLHSATWVPDYAPTLMNTITVETTELLELLGH
jgi:hypothetical protein